jgi:hypothetical protein
LNWLLLASLCSCSVLWYLLTVECPVCTHGTPVLVLGVLYGRSTAPVSRHRSTYSRFVLLTNSTDLVVVGCAPVYLSVYVSSLSPVAVVFPCTSSSHSYLTVNLLFLNNCLLHTSHIYLYFVPSYIVYVV